MKRIAQIPKSVYWKSVIGRFWDGVDVRGQEDCWIWKRSKRGNGYGQFNYIDNDKKKTVGTHKFAYIITKGAVPKGLLVCHHCDNPPCCNPAHLFVGTSQDNVQDARHKSRHGKMDFKKGEGNRQAILSKEQVIEMRKLYATGDYTQRNLGVMFNVDWRTVGEIVRMERWAHLSP